MGSFPIEKISFAPEQPKSKELFRLLFEEQLMELKAPDAKQKEKWLSALKQALNPPAVRHATPFPYALIH